MSSKNILALLPIFFFMFIVVISSFLLISNNDRDEVAGEVPIDSSLAHYIDPLYEMKIAYPVTHTLTESVFVDDTNISHWQIVWQREDRPAPESVDCGVTYPEEFYLGWSIADPSATSPNLKSFASSTTDRYLSSLYTDEVHGNKTLRVRRNIPGMCAEATESIWRDSKTGYIVVFTFPSDTDKENDYWRVIESAVF